MRTREQVDKLLDTAGVVRGFSWTRPVRDESFYNVVLDKAIADMCSADVTVRRNSTRTVAAYAEHIRRRPDVVAVLRKRCADPDSEVAGNANRAVASSTLGESEWRVVGPSTYRADVPWLVVEPAKAAATEPSRGEVVKTFGAGREQITFRIRETHTGGIEVVVVCANPRQGSVTVTVGDGIRREVPLRPISGQSMGECIIRADERRYITGSDIRISIGP